MRSIIPRPNCRPFRMISTTSSLVSPPPIHILLSSSCNTSHLTHFTTTTTHSHQQRSFATKHSSVATKKTRSKKSTTSSTPPTEAVVHVDVNDDDIATTTNQENMVLDVPSSTTLTMMNKTTPVMHQYFKLKEQHRDYLLLFRMGDFYEMFFEDAIKASEIVHISLTKRGTFNGQPIPMAGFPYKALENYMPKFIKGGVLVAICEQVEHSVLSKKRRKLLSPDGSTNGGKILKRDVTRIVTPGTLTEDNFLDARENNYLACLSIPNIPSVMHPNSQEYQELQLGLSWLEVSTGEFHITKTTLASLRSDIMRVSPSEIILPQMTPTQMKLLPNLKQLLLDYHVTIRGNNYFSAETAKSILSERFKTMDLSQFSVIELNASGALLSYVLETQKGTLPYLDVPETLSEQSKYLTIDPATRNSLELVRTMSGDKRGSLLHTLDKNVTPAGARLLTQRLKSPLMDTQAIEDRLNAVQYFVGHMTEMEEIRELLKRVFDLERCLQRLTLLRGGPRDLHAIASTLAEMKPLRDLILSCGGKATELPSLIELELWAIDTEAYQHIIHDILAALKDPRDLPNGFTEGQFIREGYSRELDEYISIQRDSKLHIENLQTKYRKVTGIPSLKVRDAGLLGLFVEIPSSQRDKISAHSEFRHVQTMTNTVRYKTNDVVDLQTKIATAQEASIHLEIQIFKNLQKQVIDQSENIIQTAKSLASIDVYVSLAKIARERGYKRPKVLSASSNSDNKFDIVGARHPTVELAQTENGSGSFVRNDCHMSHDKNRLMLITGPNMGGKSTFLRQNALIIIIAQLGSFVPADRAEFTVVDKLFSRVGAMDNLAKDQSTFMVEMVETANILTQATSQSFVIMDEVGRGTATQDGLAIAWSVVEYLHDMIQCRTLFATHYHELTDIERKLSQSVGLYTLLVREGENRTLQFLYRIANGTTSRSFGVHVAQFAGVPKTVTDRAESILKQLEEQHRRFQIE